MTPAQPSTDRSPVVTPDPRAQRDRTLRRVRATTATAGIGAVVLTGALAGYLGTTADTTTTAESTTTESTTTESTATADDESLSTATDSPTTDDSSGDDQPSVSTGGS